MSDITDTTTLKTALAAFELEWGCQPFVTLACAGGSDEHWQVWHPGEHAWYQLDARIRDLERSHRAASRRGGAATRLISPHRPRSDATRGHPHTLVGYTIAHGVAEHGTNPRRHP